MKPITNRTSRTLAMPAALEAMPPKPKKAATSARMKKMIAQLSMTASDRVVTPVVGASYVPIG